VDNLDDEIERLAFEDPVYEEGQTVEDEESLAELEEFLTQKE
jgi:hypothetical protein